MRKSQNQTRSPPGKEWLKNVDTSPLPKIPHREVRGSSGGTDITFGRSRGLGGSDSSTSDSTRDQMNPIRASVNGKNNKQFRSANIALYEGGGHYAAPPVKDVAPPKNGSGNGSNGNGSNGGPNGSKNKDPPGASPVSTASHASARLGIANPLGGMFRNKEAEPVQPAFSEDESDSETGSPAGSPNDEDEEDAETKRRAKHSTEVDPGAAPVVPQYPLKVEPGMNMHVLALDPVPYRLRCMADLGRTHRIRTTTFLGRSRKQLRPEDLALDAQDVSKIHCSITAIGNAIAGYKLSVVVAEDAKAPVSINGAKLKQKGRPYPLKVGDVLLVGLREMWKLERSTIEEMPPKHITDELELYEAHDEFLQLAIADVETYKNLARCEKWMDFVAIAVELSEKDQAVQQTRRRFVAARRSAFPSKSSAGPGRNGGAGGASGNNKGGPGGMAMLGSGGGGNHANNMRQGGNMNNAHTTTHTTSSFTTGEDNASLFRRTDATMVTLETDPGASGADFRMRNTETSSWNAGPHQGMIPENEQLKTMSTFGGGSSIANTDTNFNQGGHQSGGNMMSTTMSSTGVIGGGGPGSSSHQGGNNTRESGFRSGNSFLRETTHTQSTGGEYTDELPEDSMDAALAQEYPRCADLIEVLDELGHVLFTFGPVSSFDEMDEYDLSEIVEVLAPGLFVRVHLCFFPPLVQSCADWLDRGTGAALQQVIGGGDPNSLDRKALM
ncbi:unnamed protein product [Amoebophrya sp. A25]|nr:unnamed protein product [Amoebophrya sp. A25]|eukprot:GSA25T00022095001.1